MVTKVYVHVYSQLLCVCMCTCSVWLQWLQPVIHACTTCYFLVIINKRKCMHCTLLQVRYTHVNKSQQFDPLTVYQPITHINIISTSWSLHKPAILLLFEQVASLASATAGVASLASHRMATQCT